MILVLALTATAIGGLALGCFLQSRSEERQRRTLRECQLNNFNMMLEGFERRGCMYGTPETIGRNAADRLREKRIIQTKAVIDFLEGKEFFLL